MTTLHFYHGMEYCGFFCFFFFRFLNVLFFEDVRLI